MSGHRRKIIKHVRSQMALSAQVSSAGHAFVQNLSRGHFELATDIDSRHRLVAAFAELTLAV